MSSSGDANVGSAQKPLSLSQLITTLVPVLAGALIYLLVFLLIRNKFPRYYRPRTFLGSLRPESRTNVSQNGGMFAWFRDFWALPDTYVLNHHTLDGYLFLRFLKISVIICLVGCVITWPVLFPINITGGGGLKELNILILGNVTNNYFKMFAHAGCAVIFFGFVIYMITRESIYYINLRQAYLMSPFYASRISSRTVLYTSVPEEYMNEAKLREMLEPGVRRVWMSTDCEELQDLVDERDDAAMKLEGAETALLKTANANRLKAEKKGSRRESEEQAIGEHSHSTARYVDAKKRPTHKLKFLIGKKVDTIEWCRTELQRLIPEVDALQAKHRAVDGVKPLNSVFVEFDTLTQAQAAFQSLTHHQSLHMAPRFTGMTPTEVIWCNLRIKWWERVIRQIGTITAVVLTIIFWSIPVAAIGAISNIDSLIKTLPWLSFINDIPDKIRGIVTGLLPVVLLAVLMALLPIYLRWMAKLGGAPTRSAVELTVQNSYFGFQVIQVFLVATLSSAAAASVQTIMQNPASVASLLATNIPKASNFYLSYFILQGLGVVSGILVGLVGLIVFIVLGKLLDKTPRKMYRRWVNLTSLGWGTVFPVYTNLLVIAICYAAIAPLVLGFAAIGLFFFYVAYRYNLLFVSNTQVDTKGLVYPRALQQVFVGLYIAEVCLIGLFAIATGTSIGALGPLLIMIVMLIFTALYHISLNSALGPLLQYLPKSLEAEEQRLLNLEHQDHAGAKEGRGGAKEAQFSNGGEFDSAPRKKPNMLAKFLRPDIYTDYATMRRLVPKEIAIRYSPEDEHNAFYNPVIASPTPLLWIPRDPVGMSREEVAQTSKIIPITDEGAYLDEKNKVCWDAQDGRPPIYEEVPYY